MMYINLSALALLFASTETVSAFSPATSLSTSATAALRSTSTLLKSSAEDEIAKLRAAAAKAREEANKLSQVGPRFHELILYSIWNQSQIMKTNDFSIHFYRN